MRFKQADSAIEYAQHEADRTGAVQAVSVIDGAYRVTPKPGAIKTMVIQYVYPESNHECR